MAWNGDRINLFFSENSMHNAVVSGGGYTYEIIKPGLFDSGPSIMTVNRVDPRTNMKYTVAEVDVVTFGSDKIRFGGERSSQGWVKLKDFLQPTSNYFTMCVSPLFSIHDIALILSFS